MAPEQVRGEDVDARTDLFAFGAVLYEMLTGARAFAADSQAGLIAAILEHDPPPLTTRQPLDPTRARTRSSTTCLAKNPSERWQHAQDLAFALREIGERGAAEHVAAADREDRRARRRLALAPARRVGAAGRCCSA